MEIKQTSLTCSGHTRPVVHLSFSDETPDGYFLASACKDGTPMLRNGSTGDWIGNLDGHKGAVWSIALNSNATYAVTGSGDFSAKLWNTVAGKEIATFPHKHIVKTVALSKDSSVLCTGGNEQIIRFFDVSQPDFSPLEFKDAHCAPIRYVLWSNDQHLIFSAGEDRCIKLWDVRLQSAVQNCILPENIKDIQLAKDSESLLICVGKSVQIFSVATALKPMSELELSFEPYSAAFHPNGSHFVVGAENHLVNRYGTIDFEELEVNRGHFGPVHCVRYSPDGEVFASGSEDGTVRLWQNEPGKSYGLWKGCNGLSV